MSLILLIGLIGIIIIILFKQHIIGIVSIENAVVQRLKHARWFQNYWLGGIFLFAVNIVLFGFAVLGFYLLIYTSIPFIHWIAIVLAVAGSLYCWSMIHHAWQGSKSGRFKLGIVGSSFFALMMLACIYGLVTLRPSEPEGDTFMQAIGFIIGIIATFSAFVTCLFYTSFSKKHTLS